MKKVMLIGETGVGKSSLIRALSEGSFVSRRALAVEYHGQFINTPGEFLENHRFYTALITTAADAHIIVHLQDSTRTTSSFPPNCATVFNRPVIGLITKVDLPEAHTALAERFLNNAGIHDIIQVSTVTGQGLEQLREFIA